MRRRRKQKVRERRKQPRKKEKDMMQREKRRKRIGLMSKRCTKDLMRIEILYLYLRRLLMT